ncbi:endospore germination permease [Paenibacillus sp. BSR1-1]|uniref:GerAB/ArcD/ProY family transporter n=1 Tax=Paenibacillus sp. BSR1-1 TaxID=3020845 RepID=UPI0025B095C4|nr:endospore germination permease [Paenibacillus sp. BSR1-1]MDN3019652.1 endospore germination permease [Paenibacillus sp. BSR1-1]
MLENGKISPHQYTIMIAFFIVGGSILYTPSGLVHSAKQDAWMANIIVVGLGLILVSLFNLLGSRFPTMNLTEYSERILGKWLGKLLSFLYFIYFFLSLAVFIRQIGDFVIIQILPDTPILPLHILLIGIMIMGVLYGIETFSRAIEIFFPIIFLLLLIFIISIFPMIEFQQLQPILANGTKPIISAAVKSVGTPYLQLVLFLMVFPAVNQTTKAKKSFLLGTFIGGTVLTVVTLLSILCLGTYFSENMEFVAYALALKINIGGFWQRIEAVMAFIWFISIYIKITLYFYGSIICMGQILELKEYKCLTFPLGLITLVLSLIINKNIVESDKQAEWWTSFSLPFGLFFPLLLLIVSKIRKKDSY